MTEPVRALLVGGDRAEIATLGTLVDDLLGDRAELLAMELDTSSVDPTLAWGTEGPRVVALRSPDAPPPAAAGVEQPLPEDGDSWRAIADAAGRHHAHVVVIVNRHQRWFSRVFSGSAARDLVTHAQVPVLLVSDATLERTSSLEPTGPAIASAPHATTLHETGRDDHDTQ